MKIQKNPIFIDPLLPPSMAGAALLIIFSLIVISVRSYADTRLDLVARSCETTTVQNKDDYLKNYESILQKMEPEMYRNKFAFNEAGKPPDKIYVLSQCMNDLSSVECAQCFARISNILPACFPTTGGRVYLDGCFIRANNYSFYREVTADGDINRCSDDVDTNEDFKMVLRDMLPRMVHKAPDKKGFALFQESRNGTTVHGMAQCWKILDKEMCSSCLADAVDLVFRCVPSKEGRALNAGCFLRYSTYDFGHDTNAGAVHLCFVDAIISFIIYIFLTAVVCTLAVAIGLRLGKMAYKQMNPRREWKGKEVDLAALDQAMKFLQFKFSTLEKATDCFNEANKLGSGGYGEVFKGTLPDGREIAVKRLYVNGRNRSREIYNEMDVISKAQHKNLVRCLGGCFTIIENFLVYEYLANKSLDGILFDPEKKKELDWGKRQKIIMGTAEGLEYLHKGCEVRIIHRDIKASNILLDIKFRPKIADFGLARLCSRDSDRISLVNNTVAGTFGYMAPEYIAKGRLTEKVDVYSFGVLMLEIISGVKNTKIESDNYFETLVTDAWRHFQSNTTTKIIDESLNSEDQIEEIKRQIQLGLLCTQAEPTLRPNMSKVLQILRHKDMDLPSPTKPPFLDESLILSASSFNTLPSKSQTNINFPEKSQTNDNLHRHDQQDYSNL
ncbi:cysteine-rich receptor-like protein kinase 46 [Gossypium arboreum]|uniref:cysteine-rich receptor-like protein kinase 46 n=1 Tax=Gossypium arboreum TaxID=29729 RepID=UPI0022F1509C|nr:cysteine-rich receptor-like protein kinase 46 [Gossypium arboreum]